VQTVIETGIFGTKSDNLALVQTKKNQSIFVGWFLGESAQIKPSHDPETTSGSHILQAGQQSIPKNTH